MSKTESKEPEHKFHMWFEPGCAACIAKHDAEAAESRRRLSGPAGEEYRQRFWEHVKKSVDNGMGLCLDAKQTRALYEAHLRANGGVLVLEPATLPDPSSVQAAA